MLPMLCRLRYERKENRNCFENFSHSYDIMGAKCCNTMAAPIYPSVIKKCLAYTDSRTLHNTSRPTEPKTMVNEDVLNVFSWGHSQFLSMCHSRRGTREYGTSRGAANHIRICFINKKFFDVFHLLIFFLRREVFRIAFFFIFCHPKHRRNNTIICPSFLFAEKWIFPCEFVLSSYIGVRL